MAVNLVHEVYLKKNKINFLIDKTKTLEASPKVMIKETILIFYPLLERSVCVVEKHLLNWSPPFLQRPGENLASQSKISPGQKMPPPVTHLTFIIAISRLILFS